MKLLLVIVTVIAVFTVDGLDFSSESEGHKTVNQAQLLPEDIEGQIKEQNFLDVPAGNNFAEINDSANDDHQIKEVEKEQHHSKLRRSWCKASNTCDVMGGFCVTNATLCSGRLVAEGCKGTNCQCCVPGVIEAMFDLLKIELQNIKENINNSTSNLNAELQSLKYNMNNSNTNLRAEFKFLKDSMNNSISNINSEMQSLKVNMNNSSSNLGSELQSLKDNTNNMNSNLNSKLKSMNSNLNSKLASLAINQGCPEGFFKISASNQCFKLFTDSARSWTAAKSKCQSEGLVLAKPYNALELRSYIALRYGNKNTWLGARGTGSYVKWDRDGTTLSSHNPMWYSGHPSGKTSSSYCIRCLSQEYHLKTCPTALYYSTPCSGGNYALCEYLME